MVKRFAECDILGENLIFGETPCVRICGIEAVQATRVLLELWVVEDVSFQADDRKRGEGGILKCPMMAKYFVWLMHTCFCGWLT